MRLDIDRSLKLLVTILLGGVVAYFAWQALQRVFYPIELLLMGAIVAFILSPIVDRLHQHGFPRPLAILTVYIGLLGVLSLGGYLLINPLLNQITILIEAVPRRANELQSHTGALNQFLTTHNLGSTDKLKQQAVSYAQSLLGSVFTNLSALLLTSFNFLFNIVLTLVIAFYLLLDGHQIKDRLYNLVPTDQLSRVTFVETAVTEVLGGYLRGQLLMALTIGTMAGVGTLVLGVDYPAVIGVLAGILELVPMLGPWLASMPAVLIALLSPHPIPLAIWVALYFLAIQQLESNVIGPRITGHAVGLHPLAALMALLVGIELDGILGALFAVPVAGIIYVFGLAIYYHVTGRPQPLPQRRGVSPSLLGSLGGRVARRSGLVDGVRPRLGVAMFLRRDSTDKAVPKRLADVEQKRDALLRDKLQQRQEQVDAIDMGTTEDDPSDAPAGMDLVGNVPQGTDHLSRKETA